MKRSKRAESNLVKDGIGYATLRQNLIINKITSMTLYKDEQIVFHWDKETCDEEINKYFEKEDNNEKREI